jgi:hypothetical protein
MFSYMGLKSISFSIFPFLSYFLGYLFYIVFLGYIIRMGHWETRTDNICDGYSCGSRNITTTEWVGDGDSTRGGGGRGPSNSGPSCGGCLLMTGLLGWGAYELIKYVVDCF